jgi:hypothetical protein
VKKSALEETVDRHDRFATWGLIFVVPAAVLTALERSNAAGVWWLLSGAGIVVSVAGAFRHSRELQEKVRRIGDEPNNDP